MADLILNLASLKSKANTAGIANTAVTTTPNLCPPRSSIYSYVTGAYQQDPYGTGPAMVAQEGRNSTVRVDAISGSNYPLSNQLVAANKVRVVKEVWKTETKQNMSVTTLPQEEDIPAEGGIFAPSGEYTVATWTRTWYNDQTYVDGSTTTTTDIDHNYSNALFVPGLKTTVKARSKVGSVRYEGRYNGVGITHYGNYIDIYQEANSVYERVVSVSSKSIPDVPATGGNSQAITLDWLYSKEHYTSGAISEGYITSNYTVSYAKVTGSNTSRPNSWESNSSYSRFSASKNSTTNRKLLGRAWMRVVYQSSTVYTSQTVYQAAASSPTVTNTVIVVLIDDIPMIPATGGTNAAVEYTVRLHKDYSNGTFTEETLTEGFTSTFATNSVPNVLPDSTYNDIQYTRITVGINPTDQIITHTYAYVKVVYGTIIGWACKPIQQAAGPVEEEDDIITYTTNYQVYTYSVAQVPKEGGYAVFPGVRILKIVTGSDGSVSKTHIYGVGVYYQFNSSTTPVNANWDANIFNAQQSAYGANNSTAVTKGYYHAKYDSGDTNTNDDLDRSNIIQQGSNTASSDICNFEFLIETRGTGCAGAQIDFYKNTSVNDNSAYVGGIPKTNTTNISGKCGWRQSNTTITHFRIVSNFTNENTQLKILNKTNTSTVYYNGPISYQYLSNFIELQQQFNTSTIASQGLKIIFG